MKKTLKSALVCAFGAALVLVGCSKDFTQDINNLDSKIAALSSKVDALQSTIDKGAVVTAVVPTSEGVQVTLSNGQSVTITNGKDGKDGANGKDGVNGTNGKDGANGQDGKDGKAGSVVTIGADGCWYIDGVTTNLKAAGQDGKDGKDGVDGKDGKDGATGATGATGADGKDGKDANYWMPDVAANKWVEYTAAGVATGKSIDGIYPAGTVTAVWNAAANTLTVANAEGATEPVVINLSSKLKSLAFIPTDIYEGLGLITFGHPIYVKDNKGNEVYLTSSPVTAQYRVNPENVDVKGYEWSFVNRTVNTWTKASGDKKDLVEGTLKNYTQGVATFTLALKNKNLKALGAEVLGGTKHENDIIALQTVVDGETITSDYAYAQIGTDVKTFKLVHKDQFGTTANPKPAPKEYRTAAPAITAANDTALYALKTPVLQYDSLVVLGEYVETWASEVADAVSTLGIEPVYKFQFADNAGKVATDAGVAKENGVVYYKGEDGLTNQNKFVTLDEKTGEMKVNEAWISAGRPALGRTPLVKVSATVPGKTFDGKRDTTYTLASAYIKVGIVEKAVAVAPVQHLYKVYVEHHVDFTYENLTTSPKYKDASYKADELNVTWDEVNKAILNEINKTYEEFGEQWKIQAGDICVVKDNNKKVKDDAKLPNKHVGDTGAANYLTPFELPTGVTKSSDSPDKWKTSTNIISLGVDNTVKAPIDTTIILVFPHQAGTAYDVAVKFSFTVSTPKPHDHSFAITDYVLHHNYILGTQNKLNFEKPKKSTYDPSVDTYATYGGVRVKGKETNILASTILEHFENYNIKTLEAGGKLKFTILNKNKANVYYEVLAGKKGTLKDTTITWKKATEGTTSDVKYNSTSIEFTKADIDAILANATLCPDIKLSTDALLGGKQDILIEVTETCGNTAAVVNPGRTKSGYYYVVYDGSEFLISVKDVTLKTFKYDPDFKNVPDFVAIVSKSNVKDTLFKYSGTGNIWDPTASAMSQYGLTSSDKATVTVSTITYASTGADVKASFGGCLTYPDSPVSQLNWYNMGTDLQDDKKANFTVKMVVKGNSIFSDGKSVVTVLSTANSAL